MIWDITGHRSDSSILLAMSSFLRCLGQDWRMENNMEATTSFKPSTQFRAWDG